MRSISQKTIFWILITLSLTFSAKIINYSISDSEYENEADLETSIVSGKIEVDGNSGWILLKDAGMCNGSGTPSDPYVIEDLEIDGGGSGNCIYIRYSNVHFKIENCTLYNSGSVWGNAAIKIADSVSNGQVINNTIYNNNNVGLYIWNSNDLNISRNNILNNYNGGIYLSASRNNVISENILFANGYGIYLASSDSNDILENEIRYNIWTGLHLTEESDYNLISGNVFDHDEIGIYSCSRNVISGNTITNANIGIYINAISLCNEVSNNIFSGNNNDIQDYQGICPDFPPDLGNLLLIVLIIGGGSSVMIIGIIVGRKRSSKRKFTLVSKEIRDYSIKIEKLKEVEVFPREEALQEEEISLGLEERTKKEVLIPRVTEIKEKLVVNEVETLNEEITEKIKITATSKIFCQYCSFENENDANYCVQCGQTITR